MSPPCYVRGEQGGILIWRGKPDVADIGVKENRAVEVKEHRAI